MVTTSSTAGSPARATKAQVLVVLSGGMDSTVCAALAVRDFGAENTAALHIDYGQRTERREQSKRAFDSDGRRGAARLVRAWQPGTAKLRLESD